MLYDMTGTYDYTFYIGGSSMFCGGFMIFVTAVCVGLRTQKATAEH